MVAGIGNRFTLDERVKHWWNHPVVSLSSFSNLRPIRFVHLVEMGKGDTKDLSDFLAVFPQQTREIVWELRNFVWDLYPQANELIYDNYNALAFGWSPTDRVGHTFCSIAVGRSNMSIQFGFYWGSKIEDPENILMGKGSQYRYIVVKSIDAFPKKYITQLLKKAYDHSFAMVKDNRELASG